jgi:hypothetical protein
MNRAVRRSRSRGAAMVEAVIALPVLIVIFVSVLYVRDLVLARQQAATQARSCAWLYSARNCGGEIPAGCEGVLGELTFNGSKNPALEEALRGGVEGALREAGVDNGLVADVLTEVLKPAIDRALGSSVPATAERELTRPGLYGGGTKVVQGKYELACNLAPTTPAEVAKDAWNVLFP